MVLNRREAIRRLAGTGAALLAGARPGAAEPTRRVSAGVGAGVQDAALHMRTIPSTGESVPVLGLGSAGTFGGEGSDGRLDPLREVLRLFHEHGGRVFDTAPTYGQAERVSGVLAAELGIQDELFFATKVSTPLIDSSPAFAEWSVQEAAGQLEGSRRAWGREVVDLLQVHNLYGVDVHLPRLREEKEAGRARYVGATVQAASQYPQLEAVMRAEALDFVQVNYSVAEREAAERILPLARDRGVAVVVNEPFNGGALFGAVRGRELPAWAAEWECESWAQLFLKYIVSHPAVTATVPATSDPEHLVDNMGAGVGRLPDPEARRRMEDLLEA